MNVGLAVAAGLLVPVSAQIDALISIGLGPFMAELQVQFSASLAAQATLSLQIGDPTIALQLAINALAQLQAALAAALSLPPVNLSIAAELSAQVALAAALAARLGLIEAAIQVALQLKLAALEAAADLQASLTAGPVSAIALDGSGGETWSSAGAKLASLLNGETVDGESITGLNPSDPITGAVLLITGSASVATALDVIIKVP